MTKRALADFLPNAPDISAAFVSSVVARCKNKQIIQPLWLRRSNIWKNILKNVATLPNNALNRHFLLQPKRFVIYQAASYDCPNKINPDTSESRPCNSSRLLEPHQQLIAIFQVFFLNKPTSRQFYVFCGTRQLQRRLCFFPLNECPQLIHFNCLGTGLSNFFLRCAGNLPVVLVHPIND